MAGTTGTRGPVPKRSTERRRRNASTKTETVAVTAETLAAAAVAAPPAVATWHPIAKAWYESLSQSGQSSFYEPSDWALAQYVAEAMSRNLKQKAKFSSVLFASVLSAMSDLLTSEASRRRVRMEIERGGDEPAQPAGVTAIDDYRNRLAGKSA